MTEISQISELREEFAGLTGCCLHEPQWLPEQVTELILWRDDAEDYYGQTDQTIVARLDKGWGLLTSWSDTSGHGCQCDASTVRADSLHELMRHLTEDEITRLIRQAEVSRP